MRLKESAAKPFAYRIKREKLAGILRERPLKVAFQVAQLSKWKSESVLQLMEELPDFEPMLWLVRPGVSGDVTEAERQREWNRLCEGVVDRSIPVVTYDRLADFPAELKPDVIFIHEAYDCIFEHPSYAGLADELLCYVPYCFHNTLNEQEYNGLGNNCAVFNYYENDYIAAEAARYALNKGVNNVVSGNPIADSFMSREAMTKAVWRNSDSTMKRVIWAPHWTITAELCWFARGTFLQTAQAMTELAEQYADKIQFAFKPHPHLFHLLCEHPEWGRERTEAFYRKWATMPNTQLEEGEYTALIMQSDAMIHDSGSFRLEYLFADKPCMYLSTGEGGEAYNTMSEDTLRCYHIGVEKAEIERFLLECVLGEEDPYAAQRREVRERYLLPPNGKSAAQNIVDSFLALKA